ncbi:hypothetical protein C8F01DRAFT_1082706 [Mycena amicta]|nr:hypothetical protein C8F01DRAFT_1082706 [Mycena amicta]
MGGLFWLLMSVNGFIKFSMRCFLCGGPSELAEEVASLLGGRVRVDRADMEDVGFCVLRDGWGFEFRGSGSFLWRDIVLAAASSSISRTPSQHLASFPGARRRPASSKSINDIRGRHLAWRATGAVWSAFGRLWGWYTSRGSEWRGGRLKTTFPPHHPCFPSHTRSLRMQGSTHLLEDMAEREELAPICVVGPRHVFILDFLVARCKPDTSSHIVPIKPRELRHKSSRHLFCWFYDARYCRLTIGTDGARTTAGVKPIPRTRASDRYSSPQATAMIPDPLRLQTQDTGRSAPPSQSRCRLDEDHSRGSLEISIAYVSKPRKS